MPGSDIALGWVDDADGSVHMHDRFATMHALPGIDAQQDIFDITGSQDETHTTLSWTRPLRTCDDEDLEIITGTARVVYAMGDEDPPAGGDPAQHSFRATVSLPLVGSVPPVDISGDDDIITVDIVMDSIEIGERGSVDRETSYECRAFKLPDEAMDQDLHLVLAEPVIADASIRKVHHFIIYRCGTLSETDLSFQGPCYGSAMPSNLRGCSSEMIAAWAVGGGPTHFPENVGYPMGTRGAAYGLLEVHYDNYDHVPFTDSSGMRLFLTPNLREYDAGILQLGHPVDPRSMVIPPGETAYAVDGLCAAGCTENMFPEEGITVFGVNLHSHMAGKKMSLRHIRGGEELPAIGVDARYDFNLQTIHFLGDGGGNGRRVLPGDSLLTTCVYDTVSRSERTYAGLASTQEMCMSFIWYYPKVEATTCGSYNTLVSDSGTMTARTTCRGNMGAFCRSDSDFLSFLVPESEMSFRPLVEESCGAVTSSTTFTDVKRAPMCSATDAPDGSPDGGQGSVVGSYCIRDQCGGQLDFCRDSGKEECDAELNCVLTQCGGDMEGCDACELSFAAPLKSCVEEFCGAESECLHCGGCGQCFGDGLCAGEGSSPECASCVHCDACGPCWDKVRPKTVMHQCLNQNCGISRSLCDAGCMKAVDCYYECVASDGEVDGTQPECLAQCGDLVSLEDRMGLSPLAACASERGCFDGLQLSDVQAWQEEAVFGDGSDGDDDGEDGEGSMATESAAAFCALAASALAVSAMLA